LHFSCSFCLIASFLSCYSLSFAATYSFSAFVFAWYSCSAFLLASAYFSFAIFFSISDFIFFSFSIYFSAADFSLDLLFKLFSKD